MWDLPGPGIEPMSPALAGGFLTTGSIVKFGTSGFNRFIIIIFGCAGSSLLCLGFFWVCWVLVAVPGLFLGVLCPRCCAWLSLVGVSRDCSLLQCVGFALQWLL